MKSVRVLLIAAAALLVLNIAYQAVVPYSWPTVMQAFGWQELRPAATLFLFYGFPALASVAGAVAAGALSLRMPVVQIVIMVLICLLAPLIAFEAILFGIDLACTERWLSASDCID